MINDQTVKEHIKNENPTIVVCNALRRPGAVELRQPTHRAAGRFCGTARQPRACGQTGARDVLKQMATYLRSLDRLHRVRETTAFSPPGPRHPPACHCRLRSVSPHEAVWIRLPPSPAPGTGRNEETKHQVESLYLTISE